MSKDRHPHNDFMEAVGIDLVRAHFSLSPQALHAWRKRGIPHEKRPAFVQLAVVHGKAIPEGFLFPVEQAA